MFTFKQNKLQSNLENILSIILVITCVYNYQNAPESVCSLVECNNSVTTVVKAMFPRSLAIACLISRVVVVYKNIRDFPTYKKIIENYEQYFPTNTSQKKNHLLFTVTIITTYIVVILPINILRIYLIHFNLRDSNMLIFHILMYAQNLGICSIEIHFIAHCFGLYQKFQTINKDLAVLKYKTIVANKYPIVLKTKPRSDGVIGTGKSIDDQRSSAAADTYAIANRIELLKMRHQFARDITGKLNGLYGVQLGLSVCVLIIMALFDIYGEVFTTNTKTRSKILIYGWLLQYSFRFCVVVMITHVTIKQVRSY